MSRQSFPPLIILSALIFAGCGSNAGASGHTPVATRVPTRTPVVVANSGPTPPPLPAPTAVPTATPATTPTASPSPTPTHAARPTATPAAAATATPLESSAAPRLEFVSVKPLTVAAGGTITVSVQTSGSVQRAELYLGSGAPNAPSPSTFPLVQRSPGAWSGSGTAPTVGGTYHFTVGLYNETGRRFLEDNDGWNVEVQGGSSSSGANGSGTSVKPLFGDIPLAPPFSYGNPVQAVFNAGGRTINGSEVVSNTRTDIPASTVAQFYSVHFPRSGWSTSGVTVPAGATSFSLTATSGSRVCIVQFSAGTVHIFYG